MTSAIDPNCVNGTDYLASFQENDVCRTMQYLASHRRTHYVSHEFLAAVRPCRIERRSVLIVHPSENIDGRRTKLRPAHL